MSGYPEYMQVSLEKVKATRPARLEKAKAGREVVKRMSLAEREEVLSGFHPDYQPDARKPIRIGHNKGEEMTSRVVDLLESYPSINPGDFDLSEPDFDTDVLIIGAGGGGCMAAIQVANAGLNSVLATKLRVGDSNSMMSQGGMQAAVNPHDNPAIHYLDAIGGGHFDNKPELVEALTMDGPMIAGYLEELGVMWDKDSEGICNTESGGGTSRRRMLSCRDYTGAEIQRVLRDEVKNHPDKITIVEYSPAVELLLDEAGEAAGALLYNMETEEYTVVRARSVIMSTGGFGRLHIKGFATTNHYGATADGLVMAYHAGAKLLYMDSVQFHPTGAVYPEQILGFLITEKVRGLGGQPVNKEGELFVFPLEPRDVEAASFIRESTKRGMGVKTPAGRVGVWLDSPLIDLLSGPGTIQTTLPAMVRQFKRFGIDITQEPMLVYPTLHYQNGGIEINTDTRTTLAGLFAAGEVSGGVHGRNRLMGNSVLDYNVFGRRAGKAAAERAKALAGREAKLSLDHVRAFRKELEDTGIPETSHAPILIPEYRNPEVLKKHRKNYDPFIGQFL
ncbi:FAD-binding protein [candidate division WOR-3 bacterium]|nr:FAD-binding protein [candidate division WOR-3 bacterium]